MSLERAAQSGQEKTGIIRPLCPEMQTTILEFLLQPHDLSKILPRRDFPFSKSIIPYVIPYSPFGVSSEGILYVNHHFRNLGLRILFRDKAYAPIYLCVRWFDRLSYIDLYAHVGYRACSYKRQILVSPSEPTLELSFLGISSWKRLVLPMKMPASGTASELQTLSRLFAKMIELQSLHLILIYSPDRDGSDWEVIYQEFQRLEFLDCLSFTIHCIFLRYEDLRARVPSFSSTSGHVYVPTVYFSIARFEGANLSKTDGLHDLKDILGHIYDIYLRILPDHRLRVMENVNRHDAA